MYPNSSFVLPSIFFVEMEVVVDLGFDILGLTMLGFRSVDCVEDVMTVVACSNCYLMLNSQCGSIVGAISTRC